MISNLIVKEIKKCKCGKNPSIKLLFKCIYQISCKSCKKKTSGYTYLSQAKREWNSNTYWRRPR